jgi:hypothetical protein
MSCTQGHRGNVTQFGKVAHHRLLKFKTVAEQQLVAVVSALLGRGCACGLCCAGPLRMLFLWDEDACFRPGL